MVGLIMKREKRKRKKRKRKWYLKKEKKNNGEKRKIIYKKGSRNWISEELCEKKKEVERSLQMYRIKSLLFVASYLLIVLVIETLTSCNISFFFNCMIWQKKSELKFKLGSPYFSIERLEVSNIQIVVFLYAFTFVSFLLDNLNLYCFHRCFVNKFWYYLSWLSC